VITTSSTYSSLALWLDRPISSQDTGMWGERGNQKAVSRWDWCEPNLHTGLCIYDFTRALKYSRYALRYGSNTTLTARACSLTQSRSPQGCLCWLGAQERFWFNSIPDG